MEELNGERKGTSKYFADGFFYHKMKSKEESDKNKKEKIIYRCATRASTSCTATAEEDESTKEVKFFGCHIDTPVAHGATLCRLKEKMLLMAENTSLPLRSIYDQVLEE